MASLSELEALLEQYPEEAREELAALLADQMENPKRIFFCQRGRTCDGKPHDGVPYNHARPDQWMPLGNWVIWAILSGRGSGKTRTGSETLKALRKHVKRMAGVGRRLSDVRVTMVEGDSGLIKACEASKIDYEWMPSKKEFTFLDTGAKVYFYSAEEPDSLRGPQHGFAWLDEPAHMPLIEDVWSNLMFGLRLPPRPRVLLTSTPLPTKWLKAILARADVHLTRVSTYANLDNLAKTFADEIISQYAGTRLGRQELEGELLEDVEGALWNHEVMEKTMWTADPTDQDYLRVVVGVDPAGTKNKRSDETGIVVLAKMDGLYYVLDDLTGRYSPDQWAKKTIHAYNKWHADRVIVEKNYGGDMVGSNLRNQDEILPIKMVTSRRGKELRAEPIVGLYEQGKFRHARGLELLEEEMTSWVPGIGDSPNRVDALVHAATELSRGSRPAEMAVAGRDDEDEDQDRMPIGFNPGSAPFTTMTPGGIYLP